jgi:putative nucleotidyltransferase with HDIG domain
MTPQEALAELAALAPDAWLVGGALRDELLGRPTIDFDVAVEGRAEDLARALARRTRGHAFALSDGFGAWRVLDRRRQWRIDLSPLVGGTLAEDLARRDLAINAIARPLRGGELIDPFGGRDDLEAKRLRMVSPGAFPADPVRVIRLARLAATLGFSLDADTARAAGASAGGLARVASERVFSELCQIVAGPRPGVGLAAMLALGATAVVLPELDALRGLEQSAFHHLDVYDHTIATLERTVELGADPGRWFGAEVAEPLDDVLSEPLANDLTRGQALRFGALLHDIANAQTRAVTDEGRVTFMEHDRLGAELARAILERLRASERLATHVAALARHHLRLGFLVHEAPLDRRTLYRYLVTCTPVEVDVTVLSVADRLATLGRNSERAVELHLALARDVLPAALEYRAGPPHPPIKGDQLAAALGIPTGPAIGQLLAALTEATFAGEVTTFGQAVAVARELLESSEVGGGGLRSAADR